MKELVLPLVEETLSRFLKKTLETTYFIGVQHILETTHSMFRSLYQYGLLPKNVLLIGKCYSTNLEVFSEMRDDGIYLSDDSLAFDSHDSFDHQFDKYVEKFFRLTVRKILNSNAENIIVLDDGGKFIKHLQGLNIQKVNIVGIEQTSAGYHQIKNLSLPFPVINVARSPTKLLLESPMIAEATAHRIRKTFCNLSIFPQKVLILGGGPIGEAIFNYLSKDYYVKIFDANPKISQIKNSLLDEIITEFDCIIGSTGTVSFPKEFHNKLQEKTWLIISSSSDREFDAIHLRKYLPKIHDCHSTVENGKIFLANCGFPVNFDGERENIHPDQIQLTIALIVGGIIQALHTKQNQNKSIIPLSQDIEDFISKTFVSKYQRESGAVFY